MGRRIDAAIFKGDHVVMRKLLRYAAKQRVPRTAAKTSLHMACMYGHCRIVRLLVKAGYDVNAIIKNRTPLFIACCCGHSDIVDFLVNAGSDMSALSSTETWEDVPPALRGLLRGSCEHRGHSADQRLRREPY